MYWFQILFLPKIQHPKVHLPLLNLPNYIMKIKLEKYDKVCIVLSNFLWTLCVTKTFHLRLDLVAMTTSSFQILEFVTTEPIFKLSYGLTMIQLQLTWILIFKHVKICISELLVLNGYSFCYQWFSDCTYDIKICCMNALDQLLKIYGWEVFHPMALKLFYLYIGFYS